MTDDHRRDDDHLVEPMFAALGEGEAAEESAARGVGLVVALVVLAVGLLAAFVLFLG